MLYLLLYPLHSIWFGFNVFQYITFRAAGACITAFLVSVIFSPYFIKRLASNGIGQHIRNEQECPKLHPLHKDKAGVPTMGGLLILISLIGSSLLWANLTNAYLLLALFATGSLGVLGFIDDYLKLVRKKSKGLTVSIKLFGQTIVGLLLASYIYLDPSLPPTIEIPFIKEAVIDLGIFYIPFIVVIMTATSNAVNLTDGLDGLAIGCVTMVALAYSLMAYIAGHINFAEYLQVFYLPFAGELAVFGASLIGAGLGFLWVNAYPAQVFMGDTGSLALGGAIGAMAVFIKKELLLIIAGGIFVAEALSVILQVASYRFRNKKRIFHIAPLHHHFQVLGWPEPKVTVRFWIIGAILAMLSLSTLKLR